MTFLELCQSLRQEVDISGTGPAGVTNQTGELKLLVDWIAQSYTEIQNRHNWRWLRSTFTLNTVASDDSYTYSDCTDTGTSSAIDRLGSWRLDDVDDPPKIYLNSSGVGVETWLTYLCWEDFKRIYKIGTQNTGHPAHITVDPSNNILVGPSPNDVYVITGDYHKSAQTLSANADTPEMPERFHQLIVYRAMEKYAGFESADEVMLRAKSEGRPMLRRLEADQLSQFKLGGPLA